MNLAIWDDMKQIIIPVLFKVTSLAVVQSYDCTSVIETTLQYSQIDNTDQLKLSSTTPYNDIQYIPRNMHLVHALLCFLRFSLPIFFRAATLALGAII